MNEKKLAFLQSEFIPLIKQLDAATAPQWGKMNAQQMVEHVTAFFKISSGRLRLALVTPEDQLPKFRDWLMSEKPFRENTKAPASILPDEPLPLRKANIEEAIASLEKSVQEFFSYFSNDASGKTMHPVFGELSFSEWIQLHHKHVAHHLKQFGITVS
jgi:oxepin-CoA hydrolase/3-oxo-5,6-dehydrosuberyl-CoA semialdehyde dehydrogenase